MHSPAERKLHRLQALVFQNWPLLASNATAAILAFEQVCAAAGRHAAGWPPLLYWPISFPHQLAVHLCASRQVLALLSTTACCCASCTRLQDVDERQRTAFEADYKALVGRGDQRGADDKMAEFTQSVVDQVRPPFWRAC